MAMLALPDWDVASRAVSEATPGKVSPLSCATEMVIGPNVMMASGAGLDHASMPVSAEAGESLSPPDR